jgi:hypothetical protein
MSKAPPKGGGAWVCSGFLHPACCRCPSEQEAPMRGHEAPDTTVLDDHEPIAVLTWECEEPGVISKVGWARAESNGFVCSGAITVDQADRSSTAHAINRALGSAVVDQEPRLGGNLMQRLYRETEVTPSWRTLAGGRLALYEALSVPLTEQVGFMPYIPRPSGAPCEHFARARAEDWAKVRGVSRYLRAFLAT